MKKEIEYLKREITLMKVLLLDLMPHKEEDWLDSADVKQLFNFSERKLYRLCKANVIPHTKIGE
ncbi:helix-turn-helix domain-containing protein [Flavobacterium sediminilitoris]|uniref:Helix-turn-helix domain-containing protein n=1 Tax=Flavobacterium sediminilitoris TaxID=2024526 RepID=A0ABY4HL80_9FLAO|nr:MULTISPECIES: helix-turn-helix domain-containing protein [Flavobacterium]UOX33612.1 helix-turn-helix domain-containing protein [Flavobacterium sediminilitoris]